MAEKQSHLNLKWKPEPFNLQWQPTDILQTLLYEEGRLLEMISTGAALETILKELCSALDAQIGKVTSLISLPEEVEEFQSIAPPSPSHFGFSDFYCTEIVSRSGYLLATLEMYCCIPRTPTSSEIVLIDRAMQIARRAILRDDPEEEPAELPGKNGSEEGTNSYKVTWSKN